MTLEKIQNRITKLERELNDLKNLVGKYESQSKKEVSTYEETSTPKEDAQTPKVKKNYEYNIGGYIIGAIGAFALIFAAGWLIKLSIDKRWLNESARIISSIIFGLSVIGASLYLYKKRFHILPNIILGTAYGLLYLSIFSAYYFFNLLGIKETFIFFTLITLASVIFSRIAKSQILYIFSLIGAFAAPLILSQGENSYVFLFSYLTILNLIFLFMSKDFPWKITAYLVFIGNAAIYSGWMEGSLKESSLFIPMAYLIILTSIFFTRHLLLSKENSDHKANYILLFLSFISLLALGHISLEILNKSFIPFFYLFASGFIILWSLLSKKQNNYSIETKSLILILLIPTLFTGLETFFDGPWWMVSIIAFSGTLSATAALRRNRIQSIIAALLWFITGITFLNYLGSINVLATPLWNSRFFLYILTSFFLVLTYGANKESKRFKAYVIIGYILLIGAVLHENHDFFIKEGEIRRLLYSNIILIFAIVPIVLGIIKHKLIFRLTGLALLGVVILKFYFYDVWTLGIVFRIIAGFTLGTALILMAVFYQKFKEKVIKPMFSKTILFIFCMSLIPSIGYSQSTRTKSFQYYKDIQVINISKSDIYGIIKLDDDIYKNSYGNDLRVIYKGNQLPYFKRTEFTKDSLKFNKIKVIYTKVNRWGRTYILKLPKIPENSIYTSISIYVPKRIRSRFEMNAQVSKSKTVKNWVSIGSRSLFRYSGYSQLSFHVNLKESRFLRISTNRKFPLLFLKAAYLPKAKKEYSKSLQIKDLNITNNSDKKATVIYINNESRIKLNRISLLFKEKRFSRSFKIFIKVNRKYQYFMSGNLWQKKKTLHYIDFSSLTQYPLKIMISNNDNKGLTVEKASIFGPKEILIFSLPKTKIDNSIRLYYGNKYVKLPGYDIQNTFGQKLKRKYFKMGNHMKNPEFSYSPVEPPLSQWIIRILFLLGFMGLLYPTYKIIRSYTSEFEKKDIEK